MRDDFAVFIISHGRANILTTVDLLKECGYTGKWYVIIDNLDEEEDDYVKNFGYNHVLRFDKPWVVAHTDTAMVEPLINFAVFSRNAVEYIATELFHLNYFLVLDDDFTKFRFRYERDGSLKSEDITDIDSVFEALIEFMSVDNFTSLSIGSLTHYFGGASCLHQWEANSRRECWGFILRNASVPVQWRLNMYEDQITPQTDCHNGHVWLTIRELQYDTPDISKGITKGGNSDVYNTYGKAKQVFFPVIARPDVCKVDFRKGRFRTKTDSHDFVFPKIISDQYKKEKT